MENARSRQKASWRPEITGVDRASISANVGVSKMGGAKIAPPEVKSDAARRKAERRGGRGGGSGDEEEEEEVEAEVMVAAPVAEEEGGNGGVGDMEGRRAGVRGSEEGGVAAEASREIVIVDGLEGWGGKWFLSTCRAA